ncbi:MAG: hypothetical protein FJW95_11125 [Actinobacteria bacterium]|nr:hypothetical protein [Actinomycetota bacterium]
MGHTGTTGPGRRGQQQQRRQRRRTTVLVAAGLVVAVALALGTWLALAEGDDEVTSAVGSAPRSSAPTAPSTLPPTVPPTLPPTTTTTLPPGPPYALGVTRFTAVDLTRPTMARGPLPQRPTRELPMAVYYPTAGPATSPVAENAPVGPATQYPLMIFAHGYSITAADYEPLIKDLAAQGFVVAAPDFPISSLVFPGPASQADLPGQALDIRFLIDTLQNPSALPAVLQDKIAPGKVSVTGHSDGGVTVAAASGNSCCLDPRIGASVALAGDQGGSLFRSGEWFQPTAPPQMFIHGTADGDVPYSYSLKLYDDTVVTRYMVSIPGGVHWDPFVSGPERPAVVKLMTDFFRAYTLGDKDALARIPTAANEGGLRLEASA